MAIDFPIPLTIKMHCLFVYLGMRKTPVEVFSDWVHLGKDDGMERNHLPAVETMLNYAIQDLKSFSFIDAGCGNGWVVRKAGQLGEYVR